MIEKALDLVLAVYRLTKLFPEGEVLIAQIRQTANLIVADLIAEDYREASRKIKTLDCFFKIAEKQNWTKRVNFVILNNKYKELLKEIETRPDQEKTDRVKEKTGQKIVRKKAKKLSQRQKKIFDFIKEKKLVQARDLFSVFPKLNPRTIRRDLRELVQKNLVHQKGRGRGSVYRVYRTNQDKI